MNYMELAFADDKQTDLRLVITGSMLSRYANTTNAEFLEVVRSWGFWDDLEALPADTLAIKMRDIINSHFKNHPVYGLAKFDSLEVSWDMEPSDDESKIWFDLLWEISDPDKYRLCAQCKKPFAYSSHRATYCGTACRTQASRDRNEKKKG